MKHVRILSKTRPVPAAGVSGMFAKTANLFRIMFGKPEIVVRP